MKESLVIFLLFILSGGVFITRKDMLLQKATNMQHKFFA